MINNETNEDPVLQDQAQETPPNTPSGLPDGTPLRPRPVMVPVATTQPIITYVILGITVFVFLAQKFVEMQYGDLILALFAMHKPSIIAGEYWRLLSPALVHGNWMHLMFNMYALWILGRQIESIFGHGRFIMLYLLGVFGGNVLSFAFTSPDTISVGASTAIYALIAAQAVFIIKNRKIYGDRSRNMLVQIAIILALNFSISVMPGSAIDLWGHLGGFLAGIVFTILASPELNLITQEGKLSLVDISAPSDRWLALLMVVLAFSIIVFFVVRQTILP